jgi:hypothetical protein
LTLRGSGRIAFASGSFLANLRIRRRRVKHFFFDFFGCYGKGAPV